MSDLLNQYATSNMKKPSSSGPPKGFQGGAAGIHRVNPARGRKYTSGKNSPSLSQFDDIQDMMAGLSKTG